MATTKKKSGAKPVTKKVTKSKQPTKKAKPTKTAKTKKAGELSYYMKRKLRLLAEAAEKAKKKPQKTKIQKGKKQGTTKTTKSVVKKVAPTVQKLPAVKKPRQQKQPVLIIEQVEVIDVPVVVKTETGKNIYLSNKELLAEVKNSKSKGVMTNKLARMLQMLCGKYAKKGNFVNYSYNEDMQAYAMMMLVRTWDGFKPEISSNPFAWYTQCIKNSFIQYLKQEQRQRNIRDELLVDQGMTPSFGFGEKEDADTHSVEDEEDFHAHKTVAEELAQLPSEDIVEEQLVVDDTDDKPDNQTAKY